jgi:hypothetical protein
MRKGYEQLLDFVQKLVAKQGLYLPTSFATYAFLSDKLYAIHRFLTGPEA